MFFNCFHIYNFMSIYRADRVGVIQLKDKKLRLWKGPGLSTEGTELRYTSGTLSGCQCPSMAWLNNTAGAKRVNVGAAADGSFLPGEVTSCPQEPFSTLMVREG